MFPKSTEYYYKIISLEEKWDSRDFGQIPQNISAWDILKEKFSYDGKIVSLKDNFRH